MLDSEWALSDAEKYRNSRGEAYLYVHIGQSLSPLLQDANISNPEEKKMTIITRDENVPTDKRLASVHCKCTRMMEVKI